MEKIKLFTKKYRHILCMAAIFFASAFVFGWIGYSALPQAASRSERIIVNDDYSVLTEEITDEKGIRQNILVKGGTRFYGVSMNFHIFNRVQQGTVYVNVENMDGDVVGSASRDLTSVLDNTFKGFIFDRMQYSEKDEKYVLHVFISPQTEEDRVALWKSEKNYENFRLEENGASSEGALALQYYVRNVGSDIYGFFMLIAAVCISGLEIAYFMIFVKKCRPETAFAVIAFTVGVVFSLFTPICGGPDEYAHIATSYRISNTLLGIENLDSNKKILVRECDAVMPLNDTVEYNPFSFQDMYEGLFRTSRDKEELVELEARTTKVIKAVYIPQALGITLARILNLGFVWLVLLGRIFNLVFYIAVMWLAIKLIPLFKTSLAVCGLLPMCMQLAGNFSYDTYILAFSYLFIASVFCLAYKEEKATLKKLALTAFALCMITPVKAVYVTLALLIFIIPASKFSSKKAAAVTKILIFAVAVLFWANANMKSVISTLKPHTDNSGVKAAQAMAEKQNEAEKTVSENIEITADETVIYYPYESYMLENPIEEEPVFWDPESDILPNGDSKHYYSVSYILRNLKQTVKLVMNTITTQSGHILQCMIGTRLGEIIVVDLQTSWLWFIAILIVMLLSVVNVKNTESLHKGMAKWWCALIFVGVVALSVRACIMWTPINYTTIFGIQGRYFLPALPLMLVFFNNKWISLEKNIDDILIFSMLPLNIMVIMNVFIIMAAR